MSDAAEHTRAHLLKRRADLAVKRAEALWAAIERGGINGAELPAATVTEFEQACDEAERLLLEYSLAGETAERTYQQAKASTCHDADSCVMDESCPFTGRCRTAQARP